MALILYLETATKVCSVALADDERLLGLKETSVSNSHSELITVFIQEMFRELNLELSQLDAVAVSKGPGSYTGLRIGVSTAKGLCYALDKPLISVGTLMAMAYGAVEISKDIKEDTLICPMLDARRMEVYYSLFDSKLNEIQGDRAEIITENTFAELAQNHSILMLGDGAEKCMPLMAGLPNIKMINDYNISAQNMIQPGLMKYRQQQFENVAYFEPYYLKDFVAGKPNVKGLP